MAVVYIVLALVLMARDLDVPGFSQGIGKGLGASIAVLYLLLQARTFSGFAYLCIAELKKISYWKCQVTLIL